MRTLLNKLFLLSCCTVLYFIFFNSNYMVVRIIIVIALSALGSYFEKPAHRISILVIFAALFFILPDLIYFSPLICYDVFKEKYSLSFLILLPMSISHIFCWQAVALILTLLGVSYMLKHYSASLEKLKGECIKLMDDSREMSFSFKLKNEELMEKQDNEVKLATLNERNRIAREIHDSVGHTMSSSLLQVGALLATARDEATIKSLSALRDTLAEGMNSIRSSIHKLYEDSLDLQAQLYALAKEFKFCRLSFEYDAGKDQPLKVKYAVIYTVKEALANIIKHSDATEAKLIFREMPGFYQLIISDNGSKNKPDSGAGMGLNNIRSRVESLNGHMNTDTDSGFRIFISIPKEKE
jgi:signal transduction histidine kinase